VYVGFGRKIKIIRSNNLRWSSDFLPGGLADEVAFQGVIRGIVYSLPQHPVPQKFTIKSAPQPGTTAFSKKKKKRENPKAEEQDCDSKKLTLDESGIRTHALSDYGIIQE
jgi:hypothetical protein